ncbi:MAG TPA: DUF6351 family protein [Thermomicrobiaceae bacterium]|nr:DUF6351 family protein [Thermomicrobiaceae bacterium]
MRWTALRGALLALLLVTLFGTLQPFSAAGAGSFAVQVLSSRPDMLSGGEALIKVTLPAGTDPSSVKIRLDGIIDVTSSFHLVAGPALLGRLERVPAGPSRLTVVDRATNEVVASQSLVDYPAAGPIFSGPQQTPFVCQTSQSGLGPALDADCAAPTQNLYFYKSRVDQKYHLMLFPKRVPADVATTTTLNGVTVNDIVRVERGTINRGIYQIATLYDPNQDWEPWAPQAGWNGRVLFNFGINCRPGYHQGVATIDSVLHPSWLGHLPLEQGFAIVTSTLDDFGNSCNAILAAETMMMVKAHFIANYGVPRYTMGWGSSGGALAQYLIADAYPGLLDGIVPDLSDPDLAHPAGADCILLANYFDSAEGWTDAQQAAVAGTETFKSCQLIQQLFGRFTNPSTGCPSVVPPELIYDPVTNPGGARCTVSDTNVNVLGRDPATGFARDVYDNTGLQFGLSALNSGVISVDQFLDLNAGIGGVDQEGAFTDQRSVGDPIGLANIYGADMVLNGGLGLASTAIIDFRVYTDPLGEFHPSFWSTAIRQRLENANGNTDNMLLWETAYGVNLWQSGARAAFAAMTQWLDNVTADTSDLSRHDKIVGDKPANLTDRCYLNPDDPSEVTPGTCTDALPIHADPRIVAGAPLVDNVLKCALKPIDFSDYTVPFDAAQQARMRAIFPDGVCDFSQPGVGQVPPAGPWVSLGPAPGPAPSENTMIAP